MSLSRMSYFADVRGRTLCQNDVDWNNPKEICHSLIINVIDYLERNPNLPIDKDIYVYYMDKLKFNGVGFDTNFPNSPVTHYVKCGLLQHIIQAAYPYIIVVQDSYNKTVNNKFLPVIELDITKKITLLKTNGQSISITPNEARNVLIIADKAKMILDSFKSAREKIAKQEANERKTIHEDEKQTCVMM